MSMNTLHACPEHRGIRARLLSPKPIVTFDVQVRELARTSDCTTQFTSAEGRRFLSAGTEDPGLPNKLSAFFLACTSACLSQMLCSGACGWCPIVWQHRLNAVSVLQKGKLLLVAAERTRIPVGPCAVGLVMLASGPQSTAWLVHLGKPLQKGQGQLKSF